MTTHSIGLFRKGLAEHIANASDKALARTRLNIKNRILDYTHFCLMPTLVQSFRDDLIAVEKEQFNREFKRFQLKQFKQMESAMLFDIHSNT